MKNAVIIYQSKGGTTKQFGFEIASILNEQGLTTRVCSVNECSENDLQKADFIFFGCWTKGLMIFAQHPDREWTNFVSSVKIPETTRIGLFATYKIATGTMFSRMRRVIPGVKQKSVPELKSKSGQLSKEDKSFLSNYVGRL
ncbi:flavodoxin family protein [Salinivirga cyanobacteriivorans]